MIEIDGATGGGQLLRSALALSVISGEAIRVTDIRGGRSSPGLRPQHLTAVRLMASISDAEISDVEAGSTTLEFDPGPVRPGTYEAAIGTAGSIPLLFDTVLPVATALDGPLAVTASGGTDGKWAPPMAFLRFVKLPLLRRHGLQVALDVDRWGFYPKGRGMARLQLAPSVLDPLELPTRGAIEGARVYSKCSLSLADRDVATRQAKAASARLEEAGVPILEREWAAAQTPSPGSAIVIRFDLDESVAGFDALGERGRAAESVGTDAADRALQFHDGVGAVDPHLADQLVIFLALGGGTISIPAVTEHVDTSLALVEAFDRPVEAIEDPTPHLRRP